MLLAGLMFIFSGQDRFGPFGREELAYDPAIAYQDVREALFMVSGNLNHGLQHAGMLVKVDDAMKQLQLFHKFYQYQPISINPDEPSGASIN
jgi:hypothetical protein